jgi:predicted dienelactone hydrolase
MGRFRSPLVCLLAVVTGGLGAWLSMAPARALEEIVIQIPLLEASFTLKVSELADPETLSSGTSDLAQLDRASGGAVARQLIALMNQPVPLNLTTIADGSVGSPLLEQAMLVLSSLGTVEGRAPDLSGETLRSVLKQASRKGDPTVLGLIQAIPGRRVTINLGQATLILSRMLSQRQEAQRLMATAPPFPMSPGAGDPGPPPTSRTVSLPVAHRPEPLQLLVLEPQSGSNGRLVLISHGLWDGPESFAGWGRLLAGRGYTVVLPRHPGSDSTQQRAVFSGQVPPPGPEELSLRPRDLRSVLDGVNQLGLRQPVEANRVVLLGHSWGATTVLQLAGVRPIATDLLKRCEQLDDPERNLSWTLQCSWLSGVDQASIRDGRVMAVGAVSPPVSLLFPHGAAVDLSARVLLVSGSHDWVVPPDPEAVIPMRWGKRLGNQLVLVGGGDHFNLRPGPHAGGGALGPLLLAWTDAAFQAGDAARPSADAPPLLPQGPWGAGALPLVDVTGSLAQP